MPARPSQTWGIWIRKSRTFYYLDTGEHTVVSPHTKLLAILMQKNILNISINPEFVIGEEPYKIMTLQEASDSGFVVEKYYLTPAIQKTVESTVPVRHKAPWEE